MGKEHNQGVSSMHGTEGLKVHFARLIVYPARTNITRLAIHGNPQPGVAHPPILIVKNTYLQGENYLRLQSESLLNNV